MGINGLLPMLKSIQKPTSLKNFRGKTLGIDAYGWLHRGTVACAIELATDKPTRKFVDFAMHRVRMLQHFGVTPFLIFDGDYLPSKAATEADRRKRRNDSKKLGLELLKAGKPSEAHQELQKAVDVTPEMARQLIDELKTIGVQYIVAPYEADAQMVYLERHGIIDGIISEDSDLLVFGAKCLLTKLDQYGSCIEINKADFCAVREVTLTGWSDREFRHMAILSGCDYLNSINNMGLKTAYRMMRKHKTVEKVIRMLQFDGKFHVPKNYLELFYQAEITFLHQRVFCPRAKCLVYHTEPSQPLDEEKFQYLGGPVEDEIAQRVASGELNPMTKLPIHTSRSVLPRTPWQNRGPSTRLPAEVTPNTSKGVSIERYFKAKRVPLGELDANTYTPSPIQQATMERNYESWTGRQSLDENSGLGTRSAARTFSARNSLPLDSLQERTASSRALPSSRAVSASAPRPQKRARLCEEDHAINTPSRSEADVTLSRSRFFELSLPDPSPSFSRKVRRGKKDDITIFSDDSIEEALRELPDVDFMTNEPKTRTRAIAVFNDEAETSLKPHRETAEPIADSTTVFQSTVPSLTQGTSSCSSETLVATPVDDLPTAETVVPSNIMPKYVFTPGTQGSTYSHKVGLPTPPSSIRPSRIPLATKSATNRLTPLQSLGAGALKRPTIGGCGKSRQEISKNGVFQQQSTIATPPYTPITAMSESNYERLPAFHTTPSSPSLSTIAGTMKMNKSRGVPFPEVATRQPSKLNVSLRPEEVPLPVQDDQENAALALGGSEDAIIRDSEDDISESEEGGGVPATKLQLGRFVFSG